LQLLKIPTRSIFEKHQQNNILDLAAINYANKKWSK